MELNYVNLLKTLIHASSFENKVQQQDAEQQLKQWEIQTGYHSLLQDVYNNQDNSLQTRWLAIICFKNGLEKYWRSSKQHAIVKEEKQHIILRALDSLSESNEQLVIQYADAIATIARFEYPAGWNVFDVLLQNLQKAVEMENTIIIKNVLVIMNLVIKIIASVRIGRSRKEMHLKAPEIVKILKQLYDQFYVLWVNSSDPTLMQICYLCLKNLRRIIPEGIDEFQKDQDVSEFIGSTIDHFKFIVSEKDQLSKNVLKKFTNCYSKLYISLLNYNPTSFVLLPCSDDIITTYLSILLEQAQKNYEGDELLENLALKSFSIMKKLTTFLFKKGALSLKQKSEKEDIQIAITKLGGRFFQPDNVKNLCDIIIRWYMRLRKSDLESWESEPEEWCNEELSSSWEYQVRSCAENYFQDLVKYFPDQLTEYLLSKISNELSSEDILVQDAILCSLQLSSYSVANNIDFDVVLQNVLIPKCQSSNILRRRICLIVAEWVGVKCSRDSRILIYKMLLSFLKQEDVVVKISALNCLKALVDDWDFDKKDFKPFIEESVQSLLISYNEFTMTESKLFAMNTLAGILEKCNPLIDNKVLSKILEVIPQFWDTTDDETILKSSILRTFKNLIVSLNENSIHTHDIAIKLIKLTCSSDSPLYSTMSEDGFEVWLALIQHCPTEVQNPEIIKLFYFLPFALLNSTEILPTILSIIRSYALYQPSIFNKNPPFEILAKYLNDMRDDSYDVFVILMEILIMNPNTQLIKNLFSSGLIQSMFNYVMNDDNSLILTSKMFILFSRLANQSFFKHSLNQSTSDIFFKKWLENYEYQNNARDKKVNLIGLLTCIDKLPKNLRIDVIRKTFYFLEENAEDNFGNCETYKSGYLYSDIDEYSYLDSNIKPPFEKIRYEKLMFDYDIVCQYNLLQFLLNSLDVLKESSDHEVLSELYSSMDDYMKEIHISNRNRGLSNSTITLSKPEIYKVNSDLHDLNQNTPTSKKDISAIKDCIESFYQLIYLESNYDNKISWFLINLYINPFIRTHLLKEIKLLWPIYLRLSVQSEDAILLRKLIDDALSNSPSLSWLSSKLLLNLSNDNNLYTIIRKSINTKENISLFDKLINLNRDFSTIINLIELFVKLQLESFFLPNLITPYVKYIQSKNSNFKNLLQCNIKSNVLKLNGNCYIQPIDYYLLNLWIPTKISVTCHYINLRSFESFKTLPQSTIKLRFVCASERKTRSMTQSIDASMRSFVARTSDGDDIENLTMDITIRETLHYNWFINYLKTFRKSKQSKVTSTIESPETLKAPETLKNPETLRAPTTQEKLQAFESRSSQSTYKTKKKIKRKRLASDWDLTPDMEHQTDDIVDSDALSTAPTSHKKAKLIANKPDCGMEGTDILSNDNDFDRDSGSRDTLLQKVVNTSVLDSSRSNLFGVGVGAKKSKTESMRRQPNDRRNIDNTNNNTTIRFENDETVVDSEDSEIIKAPIRQRIHGNKTASATLERTSTPLSTEPTEYPNTTTERTSNFETSTNGFHECLKLFSSNLLNKINMVENTK
ncbi:KAP120 [Candida jiufengensis]|uniref:KAP120 n=1 Tax=Candida jiufengensis TaxID=497108 RepID=UPI0022245DED|nr:KAP120 [Candida jiufengensis]KAI5949549.1 KAP120 [Candida jiufengensis]